MRSILSRSIVRLLTFAAIFVTFGVAVLAPISAQDATPTVPPTPSPSGDTIVVIEGPVVAININIITIYNFNVTIAPDNPILGVIQIGDVVHIEGEHGADNIIVATVVTVVTATVSLNGQVTAINGNIVVINDVNVEFSVDDPTLALIKIGDVLNVDGNFRGSGNTLVLIVINITIINNITVVNTNLPANCKISKNGHIKCSKKH